MFEYKVIPAPRKGLKAKGIKTPEDRFSHTLQELMNSEAQGGWEFVRAETLPSEERSGFRSTTVVYRSVLVFRKAILQAEEPAPEPELEPELAAASIPEVDAPEEEPAPSQSAEVLEADEAFYIEEDQDNSSAKA